MMFTARGRTLAAHLGLLAFILILLAPLASQLRAESADWRWLSELVCHDGAGRAPATPDASRAMLQVDACGYCSLFSHCPALADSPWLASPHLALCSPGVATWPAQPATTAHFPRALSRAPPLAT